jgi:peptidoglycan/xylan/chitin deacetylase (PgdA/CDA1 family)
MTILTYHAVDPDWSAPLSVPPERFARHLDWIGAHRRVVALEETLTTHGRLSRGEVAITFDDGFSSVVDHALPALRTRGMRSTVFVVGAMLRPGAGPVTWVERPPSHPLRVMDAGLIRELDAEGVAFGCHSETHRDLTTLGYEACLDDLKRARGGLGDLLGRDVTTLAYPFGRHDATVRRAAADAGFRWAFAMAMPPREPGPHAIPRVGIYPNDDVARLRMKTHGWYGAVRGSALYPALHRVRSLAPSRRTTPGPGPTAAG